MPGSPALYFTDFSYGSDAASLQDVLTVIAQDLPKHGFTDVQKGKTYVACRTANSHNAVGFVGPWPNGSSRSSWPPAMTQRRAGTRSSLV